MALIRLFCLFLGVVGQAAAAEDFLPPEQAFRFEARALDERHVEIGFTVADGYYLYREQFAFAAGGAGVTLGQPVVPAGKILFDETFGKDVETHRGRVVIRLPVVAAPARFTLQVTSQGCADQGLCYPPMTSVADVQLAGFGGHGAVRVTDAGSGFPAPRAAPAGDAAAAVMPIARGSGESAIDDALRGGHWLLVVGVFFGAGLLLSFTPCVLPMLPILGSIIVRHDHQNMSRARGFALALAYSLGMALVHTALGIAAGLAREGLAGTLQTPWVLGAFTLLLALLASSMLGAYGLQPLRAWSERLAGTSNRLQSRQLAVVFAMGGLSTLIVSPCLAVPLAGTLLYISQTRDVALGGGALFSLAAGMSVPLLLLGVSAGALLPRAGAWMATVRRGCGLLLLAVAWWTLAPLLSPTPGVAG